MSTVAGPAAASARATAAGLVMWDGKAELIHGRVVHVMAFSAPVDRPMPNRPRLAGVLL
jgi:hypothetical protein